MAQAPKQAHSTIVITVAFVLLLGGGSVRANQHNEYEEIGIYPQREHSLTKPYQGLFTLSFELLCLSLAISNFIILIITILIT